MGDKPLTRSFRKIGALELAMIGKKPSKLVQKALDAEKTRALIASKGPKGEEESGTIPENGLESVPAVATPPGEEK